MYRHFLWALLAIYWIAIAVATHIPADQLPKTPTGDKTAHFVAYAVLALLLQLSFYAGKHRNGTSVLTLGICIVYAAIDEWTQQFVNRYTDIEDFYADVAGAACTVVALSIIRRWVKG